MLTRTQKPKLFRALFHRKKFRLDAPKGAAAMNWMQVLVVSRKDIHKMHKGWLHLGRWPIAADMGSSR